MRHPLLYFFALLGLNATLAAYPVRAQSPRYEAESAVLAGGAQVGNNSNYHPFSGTGFVEWVTNPGASVKFNVAVAKAGRYHVTLRYATGNSSPTSLNVYVNNAGAPTALTNLSGTGNWGTWYSKTEILTLPAGSNTIEYRLDNAGQGWVNLDYMWVSAVAANGPIATPITTGDQLIVSPFAKLPRPTHSDWRRNSLDLLGLMSYPTATGNQRVVIEHTNGIIYETNGGNTSTVFFNVREAINSRPAAGRDTYFSTDYERDGNGNLTYESPGVPNMGSSAHGGLQGVAFPPGYNTPSSPFYKKFYTAVMETAPGTYGSQPASAPAHSYLNTTLLAAQNPSNLGAPYSCGHDGVLVEWDQNYSPARYREVFRVRMPVFDHAIKRIAFNPFAQNPGDADYGNLYIAHGDGSQQSAVVGGGQGDNALGKILRIYPLASASAPFNYSIPTDNPFASASSWATKEVYARGFRNPHTFSFATDGSSTARLIVGEAGRDNVEEVNLVVNGGNYGWPLREGSFEHYQVDYGNGIIQGVAPLPAVPLASDHYDFIYPAAQWGHNGAPGSGFVGQANAGGFVISTLSNQQHYLYADFANAGRVFYSDWQEMLNTNRVIPPGRGPAVLSQAAVREYSILYDHDNNPTTPPLPKHSMLDVVNTDLSASNPSRTPETRVDLRFGQGPNGEVYILTKRDGLIYRVQAVASASGVTSTYEAEDAILSQPAYTTTNPPPTIQVGTGALNYRARGFAEWIGPGASVYYDDVTVTSTGNYLVTSRYAAGASGGSLTVYANNANIGQAVYPSTGSWATWQNQTLVVRLNAGRNTLRYQVDGGNPPNQVNMDYIQVRPHTYEAEDAVIQGGNASIGTYWPGYRASGFVENITGTNEVVRFAVQVPTAGTYSTTLRYAAASGGDGGMNVRVYDKNYTLLSTAFVSFPQTSTAYDWAAWGNQTTSLALPAELAYIEYRHDAGTAGNVNLDYLEIGACNTCPLVMPCNPCAQRVVAESVVNMYPNPAKDYVQFDLTQASESETGDPKAKPTAQPVVSYQVALYDKTGQLRWQGTADNNRLRMNIASYPAGLYHVVISHGKSIIQRSLSIER